VGPTAIYRPFAKLPLTILGAQGVHFSNRLQPRDQHPTIYIIAVHGTLFIPSLRGTFFPYHGQVRMRIVTFVQYMLLSLILFRYSSLWVFGCSVHRYWLVISSTFFLQVYTHHWHVVFPAVSHLHFQSYPLMFTSRISIPGSAVPTPPFASSVLLPGSILTHMSCPIHSTLLVLFDTHVVLHYPLGMGVPIVFHHVVN
jgi:hypothetical protein